MVVVEYDAADQLASVIRSNGVTGAILNRFVYGYDKAGNRTSEYISNDTSPVSTSVMGGTFNNLNQLTALSGGGNTRVKGDLNELGTVTVAGTPAVVDSRNTNFVGYTQMSLGTNTFSVVAADYSNNKRTNNYQVVLTNNGTAQTLSYDLNGNLVSAVSATSTNTYEWDAGDRLVAVNMGANRSEFTYDGFGRRIKIIEKQNGTAVSTNKFLWCGTGLCEQRDATGGTVSRRFLGSGEQISGANYFYTRDHLGSIRELTDASGSIRARYDYDPYGRKTKLSGDMEAAFGFTGHYFHSVSELHLALFRAYDAGVGRWLSRDPIEEGGGLNLYAYVGNDPLNGLDPYGLYSWSEWMEILSAGWDGLVEGAAINADVLIGNLTLGVVDSPFAKAGAYDPCSSVNKWARGIAEVGQLAGSIALGGTGGIRAAGGKGTALLGSFKGSWTTEFSHFIPHPNFKNAPKFIRKYFERSFWNGNIVTIAEHAAHDPVKANFFGAAWARANLLPPFARFLDRFPRAPIGLGLGALFGSGSLANGGCK